MADCRKATSSPPHLNPKLCLGQEEQLAAALDNLRAAQLGREVLGSLEVLHLNVRRTSEVSGFAWIGDIACSMDVLLSSSSFNLNNGTFNIGANAHLRVRSGGCAYGGTGTNAGDIRVYSSEFPIDTSGAYVLKTAGDMAYHTNAATTPFTVGPAVCDGTIYRPFRGFMASGTAVLAAGTKAVADAKITATSVIRLATRTPGGAQGALYVALLNAGVGFTITSTSNTDTSTVYYEVEAY